jgi:hypothetical protein
VTEVDATSEVMSQNQETSIKILESNLSQTLSIKHSDRDKKQKSKGNKKSLPKKAGPSSISMQAFGSANFGAPISVGNKNKPNEEKKARVATESDHDEDGI